MPLPPSTQQVEKMVRTKLQQQHPKLYKQLLASGELDAVVKERAKVFDETFSQVSSDLMDLAAGEQDYHKKVAGMYRARDQATEQALAAALEFREDSDANSQAA